MLVEVTPAQPELTPDATIEGAGANREEYVKSNILSHFIKGKISLTPMETVMMIPRELEHLESLVKVARKKKDAETANTQEFDSDSSESSDEGNELVNPDGGVSEFRDTEFEDLVKKEGPQQILQLIMQNQAGDLLKEELTDADDYADWIQWAADEEQRMQNLSKATSAVEESVLLQIQLMEIADAGGYVKEWIAKNPTEDTRWGEICQRIWIDPQLEKGMERQLWSVLEQYQDVFA
ncbi:unnamed protein product [Sphagnum balticum]